MPETFYGPWSITVAECDEMTLPGAVLLQSFVITGSDTADARYAVPPHSSPATAPLVVVEGERWQIALEWKFSGDTEWQSPVAENRSTDFVAGQGLTVTLDSHKPPGSFIGPYYLGMTLSCVCHDPATNPIATGNPYDFTLPEG
ncbi:hypothetical protein OHS33_35530 [Streptomyces sp. NBC_00536]|uniref:hypothetical protein n=1 Tax=Streptomyces sp. NBC_00536 TaxID=2975769 RepID=UPI002E801CBE|nr:hypothetical protein [Streptomyces sp. NBC_00536]WUC83218.1 hypothetical protein OHS33_35530 [Streptomyces sp. NBC_00536]